MKFSLVYLVISGAVLVSSCTPVSTLTVNNPPDIIVQINNNKAEITTPGSKSCKPKNQAKKGCVHFKHNETGTITFKRNGRNTWSFTTLQICKLNADGSQTCSLDGWERMQFAASNAQKEKLILPDKNGIFKLTELSDIEKEFLLLNLNTLDQDYYYKVELCQSEKDCTWADPPIENKGRK